MKATIISERYDNDMFVHTHTHNIQIVCYKLQYALTPSKKKERKKSEFDTMQDFVS